jgi:hypothetical protein
VGRATRLPNKELKLTKPSIMELRSLTPVFGGQSERRRPVLLSTQTVVSHRGGGMPKIRVALLIGFMSIASVGAEEPQVGPVNLKLRLPTGKVATLVLHGGSMSVAADGENIRMELQGKASLVTETKAAAGHMELTNPTLIVKAHPATDGLLEYVDLSGSRAQHVAQSSAK